MEATSDATRCILQYVKSTLHCRLFYESRSPIEVYGYTYADWVGSILDRRSTSGLMFSLRSDAISWSNKKEPTIALSSIEAEYRVATMDACEVD